MKTRAPNGSNPTCHPERKLHGKQLCASCYNRPYNLANARKAYVKMPPVVYAWFSADGSPDYVGRGTAQRARAHRYQEWWTPQHILVTMTCDNEWQAMEYEGKWGGRYLPKHNVEGYRHNTD